MEAVETCLHPSPPGGLELLDARRFEAASLSRAPFDHLIVPKFLKPNALAAVLQDFPVRAHGGVESAPDRAAGVFGKLLDELRSPVITRLFSEKFDIDLDPETLMVTLRSRCRLQDGEVHTDSLSKVVTALIYLEPVWTAPGGRLRLLTSDRPDAEIVAEAPPKEGALLAFRRTDHSWHGHAPHEGVRRVVMFNWMITRAAARREIARHRLSASLKRLWPRTASRPEPMT